MVKKKGKRTLFTVLAVLIVLLLVVGIVVGVKLSSGDKKDSDSSETSKKDEPSIPEEAHNTDTPAPVAPEGTTDETVVDPAQVSTVTIEPMSLVVPYMKTISGFEFEVLRTPSGTKYVQFSAPQLAGTKCTNDIGSFASIIESPTENETATLTKTTIVDGTTYGLSLADRTCTSDEALLQQYQASFSEPFSLLKRM